MTVQPDPPSQREVQIPAGTVRLFGTLTLPAGAGGIVLFAHGSGSSRHSPRNVFVARVLHRAGLGTLLFDLLTAEEERVDAYTREHRFDIALLGERLVHATRYVTTQDALRDARIGYFGASTGSAAALLAAAELGPRIGAIVSRGGRPDLAGPQALAGVTAPTLLIVGGNDPVVLDLNRQAQALMRATCELVVVPGASHLFEEPGTLEEVARLAADWFVRHLVHHHEPA
jgi:pimeloyl-ACP methyl ester carboxylesterase